MQLEEFKRGLNTVLNYEELKLLSNHQVFVAYAWHWKEDIEENSRSTTPESTNTSPSSPSESELNLNASLTTHTITFKCMGTTKSSSHQEALRAADAFMKEGKDVPVRLRQEPENPIDANAIAFDCQIGNDWKRIGYVVQDILMEVHDAIIKHEIISVKIAWVKFLLCWRRCGPGFYAGIDIAKQGSWSLTCTRAASTR